MKDVELQPNMNPTSAESLIELVNFLQSVAVHYPAEGQVVGEKLKQLLEQKAEGMDRALRASFSKAVVSLTYRRLLPVLEVVQLLFDLVKCADKPLRWVGCLLSTV